MNLRITLLVLFAFIGQLCIAQTGEDCADPIPVPFSSEQWCGVYNNVGATTDVGTVTFSPLGLNCNPNEDEIWFSFTPAPPFFDMVISIEGVTDGAIDPMDMPRVTVVRGSCAQGLEALNCEEAAIGTNSTSLTIPANNFIAGFPYFIIVSDWSETAASNEGAFNICLEELTEITVPPTGGTYTSCSGIIHDTGGSSGDYSADENYDIEICPTDAFTCLRLDIVYDLEPAVQDFMEVTGFVPNVANPVLLSTFSDTNLDGVSVLSTGCVNIHFESGSIIEEAGFTIVWNCTQDECYSDDATNLLEVNPTITPSDICQGQCVTLECDPTPVQATSDYNLEEIDYNPFPFVSADEIIIGSDDLWSNAIALPFDFCFYENTYNQIVLGSNGVVSFDLNYAGTFHEWDINGPIPGNDDMLNSIACPWHDIDVTNGGGFYIATYGTAPFRVIVFSFNNIQPYETFGSDCNVTSTQQIALYESTNIIETYISNKTPACDNWDDGVAIHGIQNALGNQATVVPGRNFPNQWTAFNDGWRFTPSGTTDVPFDVVWMDGEDNIIGTGVTLSNVCPDETEIYHAEVTYSDPNGSVCSNSILTLRDSAQVTVNTGNLVIVDVADDAIICSGESVAIGGSATAGVTYTWTPVAGLDLTDPANPIATPTTTTTYSLEASNGICIANETVTITVVSDPTPTITGGLEICLGATTTLDAGSGYTAYLWSTGETTQTIDADEAGDYSVTVTVSGTCTGETSVTITIAADIEAQVIGTTENSCDSPNGAIDIEVTTGVAPFTYEWSGDAAGQGQDPSGLTAGDYTVTIRDAAGCATTLEATVNQQDLLMASVDNDTVCIGDLVQLQAVGGNGTYIWESSGVAVSDPNIANPTANPTTTTTYYVRSETSTENLVINGDFTAGNTGFTSNYVLGPGGTFGDLSNEATYGIYTSPDQGHNNFTPCGDHTTGTGEMLVVNGAGSPNQNVWCQTINVNPDTDYNFSSWFTSVVVGSPAVLQFEINGTALENTFTLANIACNWQEYNAIWNSGTNTSATICILNQNTSTGGNDFALDDISFTSFCSQEDSITVYVSEPLATITDTNDDFCSLGLGSLTVEGSNGFGSYTYQWSDPASQTTATATNLAGNNVYTVTITDEYGCATQTAQFIQDQGSIPAEISGIPAYCPGESTTLTVGPVVFDSYLWNDATGSTTDNITVSTSGVYIVTVTSSGCVGTAMVTVTEASLPSPAISGPTEICGDMGTLDAGEYASYEWSTGDMTQIIDISATGDYTVTVTNMNGCTGIAMTSVTFGNLPVSITGDLDICLGETTVLSANTQGAVTWYDSNGTVLGNGAALDATPSAAGTMDYIAEAFDNICTTRDTVTVTIAATPTVSASTDVTICEGDQTGLLANTDMGTLMWSPANEFTDPSLANQTVSPNATTTYIVTASNDGCEASTEVIVTVDDAPIYEIIDNTTICAGDVISLGVLNDPGTMYQWTSNGEAVADPNIGNPIVSPSSSTTYTLVATNASGGCPVSRDIVITVIDPSVTATATGPVCTGNDATLTAIGTPAGGTITWLDWQGTVAGTGNSVIVNPLTSTTYLVRYEINGCRVSTTVTVNVTDAPSTGISATETQVVAGSPSTITVTGAPAGSTYSWTASTDESPTGDDIITVMPEVSTSYTVTITTLDGCVIIKDIFIEVVFVDFQVPNTFTPNGDGLNDGFFPVYSSLSHEVIEFKVFDRWGELVHDNISDAWNGGFNGKDLPADVYVYFVRVRYNDGTEEMKKGDVTLIR